MTAYCDLPFLWRSVFGSWSLILCLTGFFGIVIAVVSRQLRYALLSIVSVAPALFLWQVNTTLFHWGIGEIGPFCTGIVSLPWGIWFLASVLSTAAAVLALYVTVRYINTHITPLAIKRCADTMACGICCWLDNGHVIFSNDCMNFLCRAITGETLMNGNHFRAAADGQFLPAGDKVWHFTSRKFVFRGETLHEMIAAEVTELHRKNEELKKNNDDLIRLNEELSAYNLRIDDTVRRQEILQAKVHIHDEMNRLMLTTSAADLTKESEAAFVFSLWKQNALLLCKESEEESGEKAAERTAELAKTLGVELTRRGADPDRIPEKQRRLFNIAAQEALINAVKHAKAKHFSVTVEEREDGFLCTFENDGSVRPGEVPLSGGLSNLAMLAEEMQAELSAVAGETFILSVFFHRI